MCHDQEKVRCRELCCVRGYSLFTLSLNPIPPPRVALPAVLKNDEEEVERKGTDRRGGAYHRMCQVLKGHPRSRCEQTRAAKTHTTSG
eukprot:1398258-Rhodomonas_salina.1